MATGFLNSSPVPDRAAGHTCVVWDTSGPFVTELTGFFAYNPAFPGGVTVACGDITGDGIAEIIKAPPGLGEGDHTSVSGNTRPPVRP